MSKTISENLNIVDISDIANSTIKKSIDNDNDDKSFIEKIENFIQLSENKEISSTVLLQDDKLSVPDTQVEINQKSYNHKFIIPKMNTLYPIPINSFYIELKEYNGRVLKINREEEIFLAELINRKDETDVLEAEFEIDDIDKGDINLFREGALFIWKIGKEENNGTQQRISQIVFRRLSSWKTIDIKRTEEIAKTRAAIFREKSNKSSTEE